MTQSSSQNLLTELKTCLSLVQDMENHKEAKQAFEQLHNTLNAENPQAAELTDLLWQEVIAARRAAAFWHQISDVEKEMADSMLEKLIQLRQNYLRLMQEQ
ncbi:MAG: hypothetical protein KME06_03980 [Kastovskya adunca ATA6-11-RM4]|jgi:hypothetical protein|nr:hypothetical protein [Kastovskya adunca ATA6-11-RM4]